MSAEPAPLDLIARSRGVTRHLASKKSDPLAWWVFGVERLRDAFRLFTAADPIDELHLRACNLGTKTETGAAWMLACLMKLPLLDSVPIPQWTGSVEGAQFVLDYKQQLLSVQPAYLRLLGAWPNHPRYSGEILTSLRIKPLGGDDDESKWSVLHFISQENKRSGVGFRTDIASFDEPPAIEVLREMRKSGHANRRSIRIIPETPIKRRQWAPLREDYGDTPRRCIRRIDKERAEARWSLDEVADWIIPRERKEALRRIYATDPYRAAREHGDYANAEGSCPFDEATIYAMMDAWCVTPKLRTIQVPVEAATGQPKRTIPMEVEYWEPPKIDKEYYQDIDPASGIDDNKHNPLGLHLSNDNTGDLLVRWNGYEAPYTVGGLAAALHRHYNSAWTDIEMMDSWGINVERGYRDGGGGCLCRERRELRAGEWSNETGFRVRAQTRAVWVGCIQEWIAAFKAGAPYAICRSRAVFECLLDMELDERDKPVAGPGIAHAEDFVLLGQKLARLQRFKADAPALHVPQPTETQALASLIRGQDDDPLDAMAAMMEPHEAPRW